jgi:5-methylcytosine-specific restriction endonuclease McrA
MDAYWQAALANRSGDKIRDAQLRRKAAKSKPKPPKRTRQKPPAFAGTYREYIDSPQWAKKKRKAKKFYGGKCCRCGATRDLQVHHRHYRTLFRESMKDLEVLCGGCHANEHEGTKFGAMDPMTAEFVAMARGM